jgi:hypothetical protein
VGTEDINYGYPRLYSEFLARLKENGGSLTINSEEALSYWISVLQRVVAEAEFGTNSDPLQEAPKLMVRGMDGDDELFTEVILTEDDPGNILDETWSPIELWGS